MGVVVPYSNGTTTSNNRNSSLLTINDLKLHKMVVNENNQSTIVLSDDSYHIL